MFYYYFQCTYSLTLILSKKAFFAKWINLSLDTFPYPGVTTSFESIIMGVPVLTMHGFNFNSRCGASINKNIGMKDLIANNYEEYISIAKNLKLK